MQTQPAERAELARFRRDVDYYEAHYDELLAQYPEEWVAIYDESVVGTAPQIEDLLTALTRRGVPPEQALVRHVTRHENILIYSFSAASNSARAIMGSQPCP